MTISVADSVTSVMSAPLSVRHKAKFPLGYDSSSVGSISTSIRWQNLPPKQGVWTQANIVMSHLNRCFASAQRQQHHRQTAKIQILHTFKHSVTIISLVSHRVSSHGLWNWAETWEASLTRWDRTKALFCQRGQFLNFHRPVEKEDFQQTTKPSRCGNQSSQNIIYPLTEGNPLQYLHKLKSLGFYTKMPV